MAEVYHLGPPRNDTRRGQQELPTRTGAWIGLAMIEVAAEKFTGADLQVEYARFDPQRHLERDVLAAIVFGDDVARAPDPRCISVGLAPLVGHGLAEVWTGRGPVRLGEHGPIRFAEDGSHLMGCMELDEAGYADLAEATEAAYRTLLEFHAASPYRNVWRIWNFMADINSGSGDIERYKRFSLGRARAFGSAHGPGELGYPAATAIGTTTGARRLQVCWLAGVAPGVPLENPRQVSAYRYPRQYGPAAPTFSRAMLTPARILLISGTASIVGHGSMHPGNATAQLDETLRNLDVLIAQGARKLRATGRPASGRLLLKVFLRRPTDPAEIEHRLRRHFGPDVGVLILDAGICRAELLLEIEAIR